MKRIFSLLAALCLAGMILSVTSCTTHNMTAENSKPEVIKSPNDKRDYKVVVLSNQLEVLLVSDPDADQAAVALDIVAGQVNDPLDRQGLAHFLEHMLFLGNEKYPEPGEFGRYLSSHGGYSNAYTSFEDTNFFFSVQPEYLEGALDRFSQFFISPLFNFKYVEREINAVNSEHNKNIKDDRRRIFRVLKSITNPEHPYSKFGTGNIETLKGNDSDYNRLQEQLVSFFERYYSSNVMKLAMVSKGSISELEALARNYFSSIENKNIEIESFKDTPVITSKLPRKVSIEPVKSLRQLRITFPVLSYRKLYKNKPGSVVSQLLGDEGPGSVLSYLKEKGWATSLSAGIGFGTRDFSFYGVEVGLTPEGANHVNEIVQSVFQYIELIKSKDDLSRYFYELKRMAAFGFQFKERENPMDLARYVAANMQEVPAVEAPVSRWLYDEYKPELVREILGHLTVDNMQLVLISPDVKGDSTERWYGTQYKIEDIDKTTQAMWWNPGQNSEFSLPKPNPFIPEEVQLKKIEVDEENPVLLKNTPSMKIWFKQDDRFKIPKGVLQISMSSSIAYSTVENAAKARLFAHLLKESLNEYSYPASIAGLNYSLSNSVSGLIFNVMGYTENMHLLFENIVSTMKDFQIDEVQFGVFKNQMKERRLNQKLAQALHRITYESYYLMSETLWHTDEYLGVIDDITVEDLEAFIPQLLKNLSIEMFAYGNFSISEANKIGEFLETNFVDPSLPPVEDNETRTMNIPEEPDYIYQFAVEDINSAVEVHFQAGPRSPKETVVLDMIQQIIEKPFYHQLRTVEQLGYLVWSGFRQSNKVNGFYFIIQSAAKDPIYLESRIDAFINEYFEIIKKLPAEDLEKFRKALISKRLEKPKNLNEGSYRYWGEIISKNYEFDRLEQEIEMLKTVTLQDIVETYQKLLIEPSSTKRITYHAFGKKHPFEKAEGALVKNPKEFKKTMSFYPNPPGKLNQSLYPN